MTRYHTLKCQTCPAMVERGVSTKKATCFDCKKKQRKRYQMKRYEMKLDHYKYLDRP